MAWSASKIFLALLEDALEDTAAFNLDADSFKAALYDNDITPDNTVTSANTGFNAGQWTTSGNEVIDASGWPTGGRPLVTPTSTRASNVYTFDAVDTVSANATTTLSATFGVFVYNDTLASPVADQGLCYNYFGGSNSVTSGTFTIVWNSSGIFAFTL